MINYTPGVGWEVCFTSSVGCSTLISQANLIKPRWECGSEGGGNEMYICNSQTNANTDLLHSFIPRIAAQSLFLLSASCSPLDQIDTIALNLVVSELIVLQ